MNGFELALLNSFFELMAALNLGPSLFNPLIESYTKIFTNSIGNRSRRLSIQLQGEIFAIKHQKNTQLKLALEESDLSAERVAELTKEIDDKAEFWESKLNVIMNELVSDFVERMSLSIEDFRIRKHRNLPRLRTSFLSAGIYCIIVLLLQPLSEMLLGQAGLADTYYHLFVLSSVFITLQVIYFFIEVKHLDDLNMLVILGAAGFSVLFSFLTVGDLNFLSPDDCDCFKGVVFLSILTSVLSYLLYAGRFRMLVWCELRMIERDRIEIVTAATKKYLKQDYKYKRSWFGRAWDWIMDVLIAAKKIDQRDLSSRV